MINIFNNKIIYVIILIFFIFLVSYSYKLIEGFGFDLDSYKDIATSLTKPLKTIPTDYDYLAPLPEGYVWNSDIQDKFLAYLKSKDPNNQSTKEDLSKPMFVFGGKSFMQSASSSEVSYFMDNNLWPYDTYVINYLTKEANPPLSPTEIENIRKMFPNRAIYNSLIKNKTVPEMKVISELSGAPFSWNKTDNDKFWKCDRDGTLNIKDSENGDITKSEDYSFFSDNIPGFSFDGSTCNICQIITTKMDNQSAYTVFDQYNSPNNTCKFSVSGEIPEAYNIYIGKYGNIPSESIPSSTTPSDSTPSDSTPSDDDYKNCISKCDNIV